MSSTSIIAKITENYDRNIEFNQDFIEGNNNLIKSIKKTAFGFRSFQNLRLRVLLREKIHIKKKDNIKDTICIQDAVA